MKYIRLFALLLIFGCNSNTMPKDTIKNKQVEKETGTTINTKGKISKEVLVFCDMTLSLDSIHMIKQIDKIERLYDSLEPYSLMKIYPIDNMISTTSFYEIIKPEKFEPNSEEPIIIQKSKRKRYKEKEEKNAKLLRSSIYNRYKENNKDEKNEYQSCIISSLETIYSLVKSKREKEKTYVILFSDMIEQCPRAIYGSMYMCTGNSSRRIPVFEVLEKRIEDKYQPEFNLKEILGNRISVVLTNSTKEQKKCILNSDRNKIWKKVFEKVGYTSKDFESLHFSSSAEDLVDLMKR